MCAGAEITPLGCWAHIRRRFDEAVKAQGKSAHPTKTSKAMQGLAYIQQLYRIEQEVWETTAEERYQARRSARPTASGDCETKARTSFPGRPPSPGPRACGGARGRLSSPTPPILRPGWPQRPPLFQRGDSPRWIIWRWNQFSNEAKYSLFDEPETFAPSSVVTDLRPKRARLSCSSARRICAGPSSRGKSLRSNGRKDFYPGLHGWIRLRPCDHAHNRLGKARGVFPPGHTVANRFPRTR